MHYSRNYKINYNPSQQEDAMLDTIARENLTRDTDLDELVAARRWSARGVHSHNAAKTADGFVQFILCGCGREEEVRITGMDDFDYSMFERAMCAPCTAAAIEAEERWIEFLSDEELVYERETGVWLPR